MKTRSLLLKLAKSFPKRIAKKHHDYVGLMIGPLKEETNKILICLDFDAEILDEAIKIKPDLIITHHPFYFGSKRKILKYDALKAYITERLIENGIPLISMHTNFDEGIGGMNDALARKLNLKDVYIPECEKMMRIGYLEHEMHVEEFAKHAQKALNVDYALLTKAGNDTVKKVGIIGGGGSRNYITALKEGADIYISGDAPHHIRRDIVAAKFNYLDVPHEVERVFMETMSSIINKIDPSVECIILDHEKMPKVIKYFLNNSLFHIIC